MKHYRLAAVCAALALAGCGNDAKKSAGGGVASGEILPASVSDAMLPYDSVRSQAPLAPKAETGDGQDKPPKGKSPDSDEARDNRAQAQPAAAGSTKPREVQN